MSVLTTNPRGVFWRGAVLLLAAIPLMTIGASQRQESRPHAPTAPTASAVAGPPELARLAPGDRFRDDAPPAGWTHVAFKSTPMLAAGAIDTVSPESHATARRIRLVILADVSGGRLRRVGVGLSAPVVGRGPDAGDVIVSATNVGDESGEWSAKERLILAAGSRELGRVELAAATPAFALLRAPTTCLVGDEHETVDVMYALMVEPGSDRLRFLACKPAVGGASPVVRELEPPAIVDGPLHVKATTLAGYPIAWSFAMIDVPAGDERGVPAELALLLDPEGLETAQARPEAMEAAFRAIAARPALAPTARAEGPAQGD